MAQDQIWNVIWQGVGMDLHALGLAFAAHPAPFLVAGALSLLTALIPTARRRRS